MIIYSIQLIVIIPNFNISLKPFIKIILKLKKIKKNQEKISIHNNMESKKPKPTKKTCFLDENFTSDSEIDSEELKIRDNLSKTKVGKSIKTLRRLGS